MLGYFENNRFTYVDRMFMFTFMLQNFIFLNSRFNSFLGLQEALCGAFWGFDRILSRKTAKQTRVQEIEEPGTKNLELLSYLGCVGKTVSISY